ncbi:glycosyltransferase [Paraliobacillus zengyii]|uniref:glycosyltransferase n=1 Tax=Paraliobacillus zengyii TaxID=2213194 RepID=UPI000E3DFB7D|nr:glycosyltransferase [Paraliobacillus zengyii]
MKNKVKRLVVNILEVILYNIFNSKQRRFILNLVPGKYKKRLKKTAEIGNKQKKIKKIEDVKYKLRNLGFEEKALEELQDMVLTDDIFVRKLAAWELAMWFSNKQTAEGADISLRYLPIVKKNESDSTIIRQIAIIEAENLCILDRKNEAFILLMKVMDEQKHPDLFLAIANTLESLSERLNWINKVFDYHNVNFIQLRNMQEKNTEPYDMLSNGLKVTQNHENINNPKVSVIIPVFNASDVIVTSLSSILAQTWTNIEVIVVDDCSTDNTLDIVGKMQKDDNRIKILKTKLNSGAYVARNIALKHATGEFVTINDADDWSHCKKIETQVKYLLNNPAIIGNTSQQVRATEKLEFYRRGKPGLYVFSNMSSFLFRREKVVSKLGFWDSVRFGGDSEFIKRIKIVFGEDSITELRTGPLSFQRQSASSLTGSSSFGFPGYFMGARKEYLEAQTYYQKNSNDLLYEFPQLKRPFAIPEPMLPERVKSNSNLRHFDIIIMSDFRLDGGSTLSNVEEIKAQKKYGYKTGLIQLSRYDYSPKKKINSKIRDLLDGEDVQLLVYGEKVSCDLLIVRYPPILQVKQKYIPDVEAKDIRLIVNQSPMSAYGLEGVTRFKIQEVNNQLMQYFDGNVVWHPIGPLIRDALYKYHSEDLEHITLSDHDWVNIINVDEWNSSETSKNERKDSSIIIGRHSRDNEVKWPEDRNQLFRIYPESNNIIVKVLGGASIPEKVIGYLPDNWNVYEFGEISPQEFLQELDVFVYYTHSEWIESFGRVIIEAMAAGLPVILPPVYKTLFEDAVIYAEVDEVASVIAELRENPVYKNEMIGKGNAYVKEQFSYEMHRLRIDNIINRK